MLPKRKVPGKAVCARSDQPKREFAHLLVELLLVALNSDRYFVNMLVWPHTSACLQSKQGLGNDFIKARLGQTTEHD